MSKIDELIAAALTPEDQKPAEQRKGLEPGVYVGLTMEAYHADPALGSSGCKTLLSEGPLAYWDDSPLNPNREEGEETNAFKFGKAYHTMMLEPEKFDYEIVKGQKSTKKAGALGEGEYMDLLAMRQRLHARPKRAALLVGGIPEVSIFWRDKISGLMCKVRYDYFAPEWVVDLKTTTSVSNKRIRYDIPDYGYDVSGAMYSVGAAELKKMILDGYQMPPEFSDEFVESFLKHPNQLFVFIMQAKTRPFICRTFPISPEVASCGRDKFRRALEIYDQHKGIVGEWPEGYDEIEDLTLDMVSNSINYY